MEWSVIEIPVRIKPAEISIPNLPGDWREYPAPLELADIGTDWALKNETLLLRVPSVVVENDFNILINPLHKDMKHITISNIDDFKFDKRLLR